MTMLLTLMLAGIENGINHVIHQHTPAQSHLTPLINKSVQICLLKPPMQMTVIFGEFGVRFEPVMSDVFEPQGGYLPVVHGYLTFADPSDLLNFIKSPFTHNTLYQGDTQTLEELQDFCQAFDFISFYENCSHQLGQLSQHFHDIIRPFLTHFNSHRHP